MTYPAYTPKAGLKDLLREEILADAPYAYYPLDDGYLPMVGSDWTPSNISGLVSWLNPDDLPDADGAAVASAPAVGTNPQWLPAHGGNGPYLRRNGLNGRSYVEVYGEPDYRGLVCDINLSTGGSTVFVVARLRGSGNTPSDPGRILSGWRNNWLLGWHGTQEDRAYFEGWIYGEATAGDGIAGPTAGTALRTYGGIITGLGGNDGIVYRNGVMVVEHSAASQGPNGLALAGYMGANGTQNDEMSDSDVYEVIAYNRFLTTTEIAQVHDYLALRHKTVPFVGVMSMARRDASGNGRTAETLGSVAKGERPLLNRGFSARFSPSAHNILQAPFSTQWPEFTVEVVVRPEGAAAPSEIISKRSYYATATTDFPFALDHGSDGKFSVVLDQGDDFSAGAGITSTGVYSRDATHHVAVVVRNNGLCELYVNGALDGSVTIAFALSTSTRAWTLGGPAFENGGGVGVLRFEGRTQHWAIYDKALTAARIEAHYAAIRKAPATHRLDTYDALVAETALAYWRLGETSGSVATDAMGLVNGTYNGVTLGAASLIDSADRAATFNGATGTRVEMPDIAALNLTSGSLETWFKTSNAGSGHRGIAMRHFMYGLFLFDNVLLVYDWGGGGNQSTGINCADGLVHHAVVTFQSGVTNGTKIYLDGSLVLTTTITNAPNAGAFVIGAGDPAGGNGQQFIGTIDEVSVHPTILTDTQITQRNSVGRTAPAPGPAGLATYLASC